MSHQRRSELRFYVDKQYQILDEDLSGQKDVLSTGEQWKIQMPGKGWQ